jgi:hypothetical protein
MAEDRNEHLKMLKNLLNLTGSHQNISNYFDSNWNSWKNQSPTFANYTGE